jgi:hypothetical protein
MPDQDTFADTFMKYIFIFFAIMLLVISALIVFKWAHREIDDLSGIGGAAGVLLSLIFVFVIEGGIVHETTSGVVETGTTLVYNILTPLVIVLAVYAGFIYGGPTGALVGGLITAPTLFPGIAQAKDVVSMVSSPFTYLWKSVTSLFGRSTPAVPAQRSDNPFAEGGRRKKSKKRV